MNYKKKGKMIFMEEKIIEEHIWKNKNEKYLFELQKLIDLVNNIEDKEMQKILINQILRCEKVLTTVFEETLKKVLEEKCEQE